MEEELKNEDLYFNNIFIKIKQALINIDIYLMTYQWRKKTTRKRIFVISFA